MQGFLMEVVCLKHKHKYQGKMGFDVDVFFTEYNYVMTPKHKIPLLNYTYLIGKDSYL